MLLRSRLPTRSQVPKADTPEAKGTSTCFLFLPRAHFRARFVTPHPSRSFSKKTLNGTTMQHEQLEKRLILLLWTGARAKYGCRVGCFLIKPNPPQQATFLQSMEASRVWCWLYVNEYTEAYVSTAGQKTKAVFSQIALIYGSMLLPIVVHSTLCTWDLFGGS